MTVIAGNSFVATPGTVQFSASEFLALYPQFTPQNVGAVLQNNFNLATTQLNNTISSPVYDANLRQTLLYLLTAHITKLLNGEGATAASGAVGRVSDGTEGSVSATLEYESAGGPSQAYYIQTSYGALYWQSTARFRTMKYVAPSWDDWNGHC